MSIAKYLRYNAHESALPSALQRLFLSLWLRLARKEQNGAKGNVETKLSFLHSPLPLASKLRRQKTILAVRPIRRPSTRSPIHAQKYGMIHLEKRAFFPIQMHTLCVFGSKPSARDSKENDDDEAVVCTRNAEEYVFSFLFFEPPLHLFDTLDRIISARVGCCRFADV